MENYILKGGPWKVRHSRVIAIVLIVLVILFWFTSLPERMGLYTNKITVMNSIKSNKKIIVDFGDKENTLITWNLPSGEYNLSMFDWYGQEFLKVNLPNSESIDLKFDNFKFDGWRKVKGDIIIKENTQNYIVKWDIHCSNDDIVGEKIVSKK